MLIRYRSKNTGKLGPLPHAVKICGCYTVGVWKAGTKIKKGDTRMKKIAIVVLITMGAMIIQSNAYATPIDFDNGAIIKVATSETVTAVPTAQKADWNAKTSGPKIQVGMRVLYCNEYTGTVVKIIPVYYGFSQVIVHFKRKGNPAITYNGLTHPVDISRIALATQSIDGFSAGTRVFIHGRRGTVQEVFSNHMVTIRWDTYDETNPNHFYQALETSILHRTER